MKIKLAVLGACAALLAGGYAGYGALMKERCQGWLARAEALSGDGFYSAAISEITLYFSSNRCRGRSDPDALSLLARARVHVPLPENAHLAQGLSLSKIGLSLQEDADRSLDMATAFAARGSWREARSAALKAARPHRGVQASGDIAKTDDIRTRAGLIALGASTALGDADGVAHALGLLQEGGASDFQWALVRQIVSNGGAVFDHVAGLLPPARGDYGPLVGILSGDRAGEVPPGYTARIALALSLDDLSAAASLLTAMGRDRLAAALLDQPSRALSGPLLTRLARFYWQTGAYDALADGFLERAHLGTMPAEVHLIACLARRVTARACDTGFDAADYERRHGLYAAGRWQAVLDSLGTEPFSPAVTLDAIGAMGSLADQSGVVLQLRATLLSAIGEAALARGYLRRAGLFGMGKAVDTLRPGTPAAIDCSGDDRAACIRDLLRQDPGDLTLWRAGLDAGMMPTAEQVDLLRDVSPDEATLWRITTARTMMLRDMTDEDAAGALSLLRPVLRAGPAEPYPYLLAATGFAYFGDHTALYNQLSEAVRAAPDSTVAVLRLALGLYEKNPDIAPHALVTWWSGLTWLEMSVRGRQETGADATMPVRKRLVRERLALLAGYAGDRQDDDLSEAVYEALLQIEPRDHIALNNLAYLLLRRGGDLSRAAGMAAQAVTLMPGQSEYQSTLRDIEAALEETETPAA
ncbi:hypothetical protein [Eilatimonas milleporae]|uniref:Tetratricopeptide repeat protein n=1 Tax=Eilatimonas milleporae TaxID=911205 RepID=A0A3M0CXH3_9PROT|nr:hypothetical protein [Eilatimonas milleporae]RMB12269.1 hypothetical protein BXY39_0762 [Eilatimonas milleporae]